MTDWHAILKCETRDIEGILLARQPDQVNRKLRRATVGIAGAGGLGSVVAENLARAGVGRLIVSDFDRVDASNLNRQRYRLDQLGMYKVEALAGNLAAITPLVEVVPVTEAITPGNCGRIFEGCQVVAECLDVAERKAQLVYGLRKHLGDCYVVAASGLAGLDCGNSIRVRRISDRVFLVGDTVNDAARCQGLFGTRVGIAASMQSHVIVRILAGEET